MAEKTSKVKSKRFLLGIRVIASHAPAASLKQDWPVSTDNSLHQVSRPSGSLSLRSVDRMIHKGQGYTP